MPPKEIELNGVAPAALLAVRIPALVESHEHESEAQFRELMAHLKQVFWVKNAADTATLYVSPSYEKIWGRARHTLYDNSHTFLDSVLPEDRDRVAESMRRKHQEQGYEEEYRILRPDGTLRWIWARTYPVCDDEGIIQRYAGIAEDITDKKFAEKELSRLAAIIEHTEDVIVSTTLNGIIIGWNRGAERKYGFTEEEILGHSISVLIPSEHLQAHNEMIKRVRKGEMISSYDVVRRKKDGSLLHLAIAVAPIESREGNIVGVSNVGQDISRIKKLEADLIEAQKMELIAHLTAGVTHDFNNILGIVLGYSQMMLEDMLPDSPLHQSVTAICRAAERGAGLTKQLLIFSRKETLQPVVLNLNEVVNGIASMLRQLVDEGINLTIECGAKESPIRADAGYLGQVLMNLVVNARDAMPSGGEIYVTTSNIVYTEASPKRQLEMRPGEYVLLSVRDTGQGMTDEVKSRLFEPFFTSKPKGKGTGLGLTTCQTIIKQFGGYVHFVSEIGKGTTFEIYFPREAPAALLFERTVPILFGCRGTEKLLIVEDDADLRNLVCMGLRSLGYEVLVANNGRDGLRTILANRGGDIKLVISDVIMPLMGGNEMAATIENRNPDLKILFTSGYTEEAIAVHGGIDPNIAFISKPYTVSTLARRVYELLHSPQQERALASTL